MSLPPAKPAPGDDDSALDEEIDLPLTDDLGSDDEPDPEGALDDLLTPIADHEDDPLDDADATELETGVDLDPLDEDAGAADEREIDVGPVDEGVHFDDVEDSDEPREDAG